MGYRDVPRVLYCGLTPRQERVLGLLAAEAPEVIGAIAWQRLTSLTGIGERGLKRITRELKDQGLILILQPLRHSTSLAYVLNLERWPEKEI